MKPVVLIIASSTLALFLVVQFIHPDFTPVADVMPGDIGNHLQIPQQVRDVMLTSCYDCHSDNTVWPWYSRIAPVSWFIDYDIRRGKAQLNLSYWNELKRTEQVMMLQVMCREMESNEMPLEQYVLMHHDAGVSEEDIAAFCAWAWQQVAVLQTGSLE